MLSTYGLIKQLHLVLVLLSVTGFVLRVAILNFSSRGAAYSQHFAFKRLPHLNDSLLLCAGLYLAFSAGFTPINSPWLAAKLIALLGYIVFAAQVIKQKGSGYRQGISFIIALLCFGYMLKLALTKTLV